MTGKFDDLAKFPAEPVSALLAQAGILLQTPLEAPETARAPEVLAELDRKGAAIDLFRVLAVLLPARERVWWACMAARDYLEARGQAETAALAAAEAWVHEPSERNRISVRNSLDGAYVDDETVHCATAALYADGTLGPGEMTHYPAPAGASEHAAFAMNRVAFERLSASLEDYGQILAGRALDLARGATGRFEPGGLFQTGA